MPPKSTSVGLTIRLKNQKQTVLLVLPASATISTLKTTLCKALNETATTEDNDDIPIPKPSFDVASEDDEDVVVKPESKSISPSDIKLGLPLDRSDLSKGWNDITDSKGSIESIGIVEGSLLAFSISEEEFDVEIPNDLVEEE